MSHNFYFLFFIFLVCFLVGGWDPVVLAMNVPLEIVEMLESNLSGVDSDNAALICNMVPGMVDDDNQPLPENILSPTDEAPNAPQFFSNWEHSGNCYRCLEGGRRNKARLSFNSEVKPTIEQIFEMFFFSRILSSK